MFYGASRLRYPPIQVYKQSTPVNHMEYLLYQVSAFWLSDFQSLTKFFTCIRAINLALVRTVKFRLDADHIFAAFRANFSVKRLKLNRQYDLEEVVSGCKLKHLIIELPCGFQVELPSIVLFSICNSDMVQMDWLSGNGILLRACRGQTS